MNNKIKWNTSKNTFSAGWTTTKKYATYMNALTTTKNYPTIKNPTKNLSLIFINKNKSVVTGATLWQTSCKHCIDL